MASETPITSSDQKSDASPLNKDFAKNDYYVLSSDFQGTTRLALQQYIWQQALGFNIHPSIPDLQPTASVADVACGTALWLVEVGRQLDPSSDLHAFDINLKQAPPQQWLPANLKLHHWNMFDPVPEEFVGRFDLVHVRLITVIVKDNNPVSIIRNLCRLLKPGGYLQWDEIDVVHSFVVKADPSLEVPGMDAWCAWMANSVAASQNEWKEKAIGDLQANGFEEAKRYDMTDCFVQHMHLMRYNNDQLLMLTEQYARLAFAGGHERGAQLLQTVEAAAKDAEKGCVLIIPPFCFVAKKKGA